MSHKIISCTGYGNTGSSAATNFFEEFSNVLSVGGSEFEFSFLHEADGIIDLFYALTEGHRLKVDLAVKRFLRLVKRLNFANPLGKNYKDIFNNKFLDFTYKYLDDLEIIKWNGHWHRLHDVQIVNYNETLVKEKFFNRLIKKNGYKLYEPDSWRPGLSLRDEMYYGGIDKSKFIEVTKSYLLKLLDEFDPNNQYEYLLFDQLVPANCNSLYTQLFDNIFVVVVDRDPRDLYFANKVFWNSG